MRRAAFYMGRTYTTRHLNAVRSPLMTGFISCTGLSMTQCAFSTSPLRAMPSGLCEEAELALVAASELMMEAGGCNAAMSGFGTLRSPFAVMCSGRAMATGVTSALCGKVILSLPMRSDHVLL